MSSDAIADMTLQLARISPKTVWAFLRLRFASGVEGVGEASLAGRERALLDAAIAHLPQWRDFGGLDDVAIAGLPLPVASLRSAFDAACRDAWARSRGKNLAQELGGASDTSIPLYANINRRILDRSPEGFAVSAAHAMARGFGAVKIAPFDEVDQLRCGAGEGEVAMQAGLARIAAVREMLGPDRALMVDCHWRFDASTARTLVEAIAPFDLHWLECPVPEDEAHIPVLAALRASLNRRGVRLAGLEECVGTEAFLAFARRGAYDVMMPDIKYVGGVDEMLRTGEALHRLGVEVSPHNPTGPICHATSLQLCAVLPGFTRLETQLDETPLFEELATPALPSVDGGRSRLPTGHGIGIGLDDACLAPLVSVELRMAAGDAATLMTS
jgi:galactonate dehydratase